MNSFLLLSATTERKPAGGEILTYGDQFIYNKLKYMNNGLINSLEYIVLIKAIICLMILVVFIMILLRLMGYNRISNPGGLSSEVQNFNSIQKRDKRILRYSKYMQKLVTMCRSLGLSVSETQRDYLEYNLRRAGINSPSGDRSLTAEEFNSVIKAGTLLTTVVGLVVMIVISVQLGVILIIGSMLGWSTIPFQIVRSKVQYRDGLIKQEFFKFYSEIHYAIKDGENPRLSDKARKFSNMADTEEMVRFSNTCADYWDLYGEGEGSPYIAKEFREIPDVVKLMRIVKQYTDGADIKSDLEGFREQLMLEQVTKMERVVEKRVEQVLRESGVVMILLAQVILSLTVIYFRDLGSAFTMFK